jgi:hemolysin III
VLHVVVELKPRLRGWLHLGSVPLTLAAGTLLVVLSPSAVTRAGSGVFMGSALALFSGSALYHRGHWSLRTAVILRRLDHANIFLLIAGSYTAYSVLLLQPQQRTTLLWMVWSAALAGLLFRVVWVEAPRWLHTPLYVVVGGAAFLYVPDFFDGATRLGPGVGAVTLLMLAIGGGLYVLGAVVYGVRRPDPWPTWFGFHEVFHTLTVLAFACHFVGAFLATLSLR